MRRIGAVEFATTIAPGLRDVLLTGKIKEIVTRAEKGKQPVYDAIVVDSPPTGRIARFLDVTKAVSDLAKGGPVHSQAEGVVKLLHSDLTAIHLVTLLEALPIQETLEAIEELRGTGPADRQRDRQPQHPGLSARRRPRQGRRGRHRRRRGARRAREGAESRCPTATSPVCSPRPSSTRRASRPAPRAPSNSTSSTCRGWNCPRIPDGVDLGSLYELAEALAQQGVR